MSYYKDYAWYCYCGNKLGGFSPQTNGFPVLMENKKIDYGCKDCYEKSKEDLFDYMKRLQNEEFSSDKEASKKVIKGERKMPKFKKTSNFKKVSALDPKSRKTFRDYAKELWGEEFANALTTDYTPEGEKEEKEASRK